MSSIHRIIHVVPPLAKLLAGDLRAAQWFFSRTDTEGGEKGGKKLTSDVVSGVLGLLFGGDQLGWICLIYFGSEKWYPLSH